jgi:integrase
MVDTLRRGLIGIRRDRYGFRAYVKVGALQREKRFPPETSLKTMQAWRDECRVALRALPVRTTRGTLAADVAVYLALETVKTLVSVKSLRCELMAWVDRYGDWPRTRLTRDQVLESREAWLTEGKAPKTINHRVRALRGLYHRLDGSKASTPCDDVKKLEEPDPAPHFVSAKILRRVAQNLPDAKTRARFMVLASTGQRPAQLRRAQKGDVSLVRRVWFVRPAKGGQPIPVALTTDMLIAFKAFIAADAWGSFDGSDYAKRLYAAGWPKDVRPYNLKHTLGITLAEANAEWEDIKDWFGHTDVKTTRIYTGLVASRLKRTGRLLDKRIGWQSLALPAFSGGRWRNVSDQAGKSTGRKQATGQGKRAKTA